MAEGITIWRMVRRRNAVRLTALRSGAILRQSLHTTAMRDWPPGVERRYAAMQCCGIFIA
ncbi:hypothetical protein [Zoogloea oleivorans]|jgi:hypothetical protein|uniref:hypothetical protein n=1 Tax=Zoogloea oleivorans TaxID=1552750 RepID=UPI002A360595|nr:hypothetical protein [Zoogloea oleivorans]